MTSADWLARVRAALLSAPDSTASVVESGARRRPDATLAAVLFPVVLREEGLSVLLTQRTAHLRDHPGQVSFPGGRVEAEDGGPAETALRETEEEIGLSRHHIEVVGYLPDYFTGTGFRVTPVVAWVQPPFALKLDAFEVAEVFEVPLNFLLDQGNHERMAIHTGGIRRRFFSMPYQNRFIWGATAGMIRLLHDRMDLPADCGIAT